MVTPTLAFATSYWDGEHLQCLPRPKEPGTILPLDAFRCEFMGHNWGVPAELLHYPSGPLKRSEAMALALHDVPVRPGGMNDVEELARCGRRSTHSAGARLTGCRIGRTADTSAAGPWA